MSEPFWKKEISFRRKSQPVTEAEQSIAPAVKAILEPEAARDVPAAPTPSRPPAEAVPVLPAVTGDYGWLTTHFDPTDVPTEMPAITPPPVSIPESSPPPVSSPVAAQEPEPQAVSESEPVGTEVVKPASTPFWKKELSFSRGRKTSSKPEKQPMATKKAKTPSEKSVPFWKKNVTLRRARTAETSAGEPQTTTEKKPPLWKRELKFSKPKLERKPKQAKEARGKQPKTVRSSSGAGKGAVIGLKIGASQIAVARVSNNGAPQLLQVARAELPDGVVVGGELRDIETLAQTLKKLFAENKLPKRGVRLGIANNRIGVRTFEISGIDDSSQLANAIRFRAQETLPIPLEEAVLDWRVLSETLNEETGETVRRVLLVVAYRELVERYVDACKRAGIRVSGIDLEAFAMLRALSEPSDPDENDQAAAQVVVNVGHDRSTFAVSNGRVCEFTRVLGWGGQNLSVAIARALDLAPSQATPIKHALSLHDHAPEPEGIDPAALGAARSAVTGELQSFARELVSSLRFYQNQPGSLGIGQLVLTGGSSHLPGFTDELQRLIGVPVSVGDPLSRVAIPKKFREADCAIGSLTVAIGLGIED